MLAAKEPVRIQTYSMHDFSLAAPPRGPCMARQGFPAESDFSYHGPQFWGVQRCVQMVRAHEAATGTRYDYIVRARPDDAFSRSGLAELSCGIRRSERTQRGLKSSAVWMAGDGFQVATRPALPALEAIWDGKGSELLLKDPKSTNLGVLNGPKTSTVVTRFLYHVSEGPTDIHTCRKIPASCIWGPSDTFVINFHALLVTLG